MAIKRVWLDESEDECTSCGMCESIAPEVFEIPDKMKVKPGVDFSRYDKLIKEAADSCPTGVIAIDEE